MPDDRKSDLLPLTHHAEAVALFRSEIIGALCRRDLDHGELAEELRTLSQRRTARPVPTPRAAIRCPRSSAGSTDTGSAA